MAAYAFLGAIFLMFHVGRSNMKLEAAEKTRAPKVGGNYNVPLFWSIGERASGKKRKRKDGRKGEKKEGREIDFKVK